MSENIKFTHLHVHSEYSLLDGSSKIKELAARAKELNMDAVAITDHGVMFGVIDFYKEAKANGIKPILGCEIYVSNVSMHNKENTKDNFYYHLVLLAETNEGYRNLTKIVSYGFTEGFYYKPRVDIETLRKYHKGIIALSACLSGPVAKNLLNRSYAIAKEQAILFNDIFGQNNFFIEIQDHGLSGQKQTNPQLIQIARETDIPLVLTNDVHYTYETDVKAHEILLCIQTGKTMEDEDRMIYEGGQFFLKSPEQMLSLFPDLPDALENTVEISKRCNVEIKFHEYKLPKYELPDGEDDSYGFLKKLCFEGLTEHYREITDELNERITYELGVISSMGFVDYFLVVWDFIKFARDNGIIVGPGRGSAAGCLVAYCLHITNIEPLQYNLLFERFLNPERISMPDIDIDFCYERRQEVIDYVNEKYGSDHVTQIITFGTMQARGVIRDVGRALAMPYNEVDRIAKMIPMALGMTLDRALEISSELQDEYESDEKIKYLIDMSKRLEGLPRHASTHAAGVVICNDPVIEHIPLNQNDGVITTQFPMNTVEELGLLKMDFLGLRTLTVIQQAVSEINRNHNINLDIEKINLSDSKVYDMISQAYTEGVFQLESAGMKSFMKELKPSSLEDLIAGISLYRPGPMDFIPKYVMGKNNPQSIVYRHPLLEPILKPTYGCIVYQEQVMQIVRELAGYSLGRSDLIRRAMSKKKADVMAEERRNFVYGLGDSVPGCIKNGIPRMTAELIFDDMTDFAKYAFNKSHAAAYALVGYQTAWLKYYYPKEFMAALMTSVMDFAEKVAEYINECKKINIPVLPPDVNEGFGHFTVTDKGIRFGLSAIKNVGRHAIAALVKERESNGKFKSLTDFISRLGTGILNKRCIDSLIKAGSFDSLGGKRSQYSSVYEKVIDGISNVKKRNIEGQMSLFDFSGGFAGEEDNDESIKDSLPDIPEFTLRQLLSDEKMVLGIYVSGHPMREYMDEANKYITNSSTDFFTRKTEVDTDTNTDIEFNDESKLKDNQDVVVSGIIMSKSVKYTKNNDAMAFVTIEDLYGMVEILLFPKIYDRYSKMLTDGRAVVICGRASVREDRDSTVICNDIQFLTGVNGNTGDKTLWLKIPKDMANPYDRILEVLKKHRGGTPVVIYDEKSGQRLKVNEENWVNINNDMLSISLKRILGEKSVAIK